MTDLAELVKQAVARYEALSPLEKARANYDQRRSWIKGEIGLSHPELSDTELDRIIDQNFEKRFWMCGRANLYRQN